MHKTTIRTFRNKNKDVLDTQEVVDTRDFTDEFPATEKSEGPELIEESEEYSLRALLDSTTGSLKSTDPTAHADVTGAFAEPSFASDVREEEKQLVEDTPSETPMLAGFFAEE